MAHRLRPAAFEIELSAIVLKFKDGRRRERVSDRVQMNRAIIPHEMIRVFERTICIDKRRKYR